MKRLIFCGVLILIFLAACNPPSDEMNDKQAAAIPAPVQNMVRVTVYLDSDGPAGSRAMNKDFAMMGCDYFEVVFVGNRNGTLIPAMGQWRNGEKARVNDIHRTAGGVNYNSIDPNPATSDTGSAILLAGKSDKTIMAIGRLAAGSTIITTNTPSVTFEVAAVKTGIDGNLNLSKFLTAVNDTTDTRPPSYPAKYSFVSVGNTDIVSELIGGEEFWAFKLVSGQAIKAEYTFSLEPDTSDFNTYKDGLRIAAKGTAEKKHPSYTLPEGGNIRTDSKIILDQRTGVTMDNNQGVGGAFEPVVRFIFNTNAAEGTVDGSIFALVFEIPVYALGYNKCLWYIRPGYGVLNYELDHVSGGMGGAVLIKTGDVPVPSLSSDFIIRIKTKPEKWRYRWSTNDYRSITDYPTSSSYNSGDPVNETLGSPPNTTWEFDRVFRYDGLEVELREANPPNNLITNDPHYASMMEDQNLGIISNSMLHFYIGKERVLPNYPSGSPTIYVLPNEFYGLIEVTVRFTDTSTGIWAEDVFYILASGNHQRTYMFDYANHATIFSRVIDVPTGYDFSILQNNIQNAGNNVITIVRLTGNVNMTGFELNLPDNNRLFNRATLIMFVAGGQNAGNQPFILGRGSYAPITTGTGPVIQFNENGSVLAALYFGKWPFDGLLRSPTKLNTSEGYPTYPFTIYTDRSITNDNNPLFNNKMITDSSKNGGIFNVKLGGGGKDIMLTNPNLLH